MRTILGVAKIAVIGAMLALSSPLAKAQQAVRIGLGAPTLSFLPIWSARALDTFKSNGLTATVVALPGGDASALAALDAGDIELAAVGPDAMLRAAAKGQPFEIVYSLMSKVTLQLVVSPALLERTRVKATDPLDKKLATLKGTLVGATALAGAQEIAARWLAAKGGLDPKNDLKVAQVGNPTAIQAALEAKRIDAFVLSPPEGYLAEKAGTGVVLVSLGDDFPLLANQPYLVLVAKKPISQATADLITKTAKALQEGGAAAVSRPDETASAIQKQFFTKADPQAIKAALKTMSSGVADGGKIDVQNMQNALTFAKEVGTNFGKEFDAKSSENDLWTNQYVDAAKAK
ncbi:ABC-type nitrate/sulfonate/bicarbonate transport system, substrate-binding protein [Bradyrhizobium sp. Rc2d]|uniref:ABC transporter substrate-binding protein n=1 Tax=Bradyrhizobium sp. Rc2d TaxID=1855321 RepID=UPI000891888A|nr:ABC transporter substrate-binding protein [Bradyrhizobium sp. Rc2d]SDJ37581.1 ABC-type nitrate/sulfonate/bicarbonate transport system, substrate-binding protein [Bradyrhizobium sp. Rc2d]